MHQRRRVNHLGDLRQAPVPSGELTIRSESARHQQHDAGAQTLASGAEQMLCSSLKNRVPRSNQAAQIAQQGLEVGLDGLKQLCNRGHDPLR